MHEASAPRPLIHIIKTAALNATELADAGIDLVVDARAEADVRTHRAAHRLRAAGIELDRGCGKRLTGFDEHQRLLATEKLAEWASKGRRVCIAFGVQAGGHKILRLLEEAGVDTVVMAHDDPAQRRVQDEAQASNEPTECRRPTLYFAQLKQADGAFFAVRPLDVVLDGRLPFHVAAHPINELVRDAGAKYHRELGMLVVDDDKNTRVTAGRRIAQGVMSGNEICVLLSGTGRLRRLRDAMAGSGVHLEDLLDALIRLENDRDDRGAHSPESTSQDEVTACAPERASQPETARLAVTDSLPGAGRLGRVDILIDAGRAESAHLRDLCSGVPGATYDRERGELLLGEQSERATHRILGLHQAGHRMLIVADTLDAPPLADVLKRVASEIDVFGPGGHLLHLDAIPTPTSASNKREKPTVWLLQRQIDVSQLQTLGIDVLIDGRSEGVRRRYKGRQALRDAGVRLDQDLGAMLRWSGARQQRVIRDIFWLATTGKAVCVALPQHGGPTDFVRNSLEKLGVVIRTVPVSTYRVEIREPNASPTTRPGRLRNPPATPRAPKAPATSTPKKRVGRPGPMRMSPPGTKAKPVTGHAAEHRCPRCGGVVQESTVPRFSRPGMSAAHHEMSAGRLRECAACGWSHLRA